MLQIESGYMKTRWLRLLFEMILVMVGAVTMSFAINQSVYAAAPLIASTSSDACNSVTTPGLRGNLDCSNGKNPIFALLQFVINYAVRLLIVLAVVAIVVSGIQYIISQGNPEGIKAAKSRLTNAIVGLILLALMFVILNILGVT